MIRFLPPDQPMSREELRQQTLVSELTRPRRQDGQFPAFKPEPGAGAMNLVGGALMGAMEGMAERNDYQRRHDALAKAGLSGDLLTAAAGQKPWSWGDDPKASNAPFIARLFGGS